MGYTRLVETKIKTALFFLATSRQFMVPKRFVFKRYEGEVVMPASTDGSAEHSKIKSIFPSPSKSSLLRISPWVNSIPAFRSLEILSSEPRRLRLSKTNIFNAGCFSFNLMARLEPTKPAPPVTRILLGVFVFILLTKFLYYLVNVICIAPFWVMLLEFGYVWYIPYMITNAISFFVLSNCFFP